MPLLRATPHPIRRAVAAPLGSVLTDSRAPSGAHDGEKTPDAPCSPGVPYPEELSLLFCPL